MLTCHVMVVSLPRLPVHRGETDRSGEPRLLLLEPNRGVKQLFEVLYAALTKKHAMEYAKLMKQYEQMRASAVIIITFVCTAHSRPIMVVSLFSSLPTKVAIIKYGFISCTFTRGWSSVSSLGYAGQACGRVLLLVRSLGPLRATWQRRCLLMARPLHSLSCCQRAALQNWLVHVFQHLNSPPDSF